MCVGMSSLFFLLAIEFITQMQSQRLEALASAHELPTLKAIAQHLDFTALEFLH